jgi:hypothetical protein
LRITKTNQFSSRAARFRRAREVRVEIFLRSGESSTVFFCAVRAPLRSSPLGPTVRRIEATAADAGDRKRPSRIDLTVSGTRRRAPGNARVTSMHKLKESNN